MALFFGIVSAAFRPSCGRLSRVVRLHPPQPKLCRFLGSSRKREAQPGTEIFRERPAMPRNQTPPNSNLQSIRRNLRRCAREYARRSPGVGRQRWPELVGCELMARDGGERVDEEGSIGRKSPFSGERIRGRSERQTDELKGIGGVGREQSFGGLIPPGQKAKGREHSVAVQNGLFPSW